MSQYPYPVRTRVSAETWKYINKEVKHSGLTFSEWVRQRLAPPIAEGAESTPASAEPEEDAASSSPPRANITRENTLRMEKLAAQEGLTPTQWINAVIERSGDPEVVGVTVRLMQPFASALLHLAKQARKSPGEYMRDLVIVAEREFDRAPEVTLDTAVLLHSVSWLERMVKSTLKEVMTLTHKKPEDRESTLKLIALNATEYANQRVVHVRGTRDAKANGASTTRFIASKKDASNR